MAGKADLNILPRDSASPEPKQPNSDVLRALTGQVAKVSEVAAGSFELGQAGREFLSGLPAFDTAYQVLALPERFTQPPVDAAVADRMLHWPGDTVAPHSMLVWRDPTGLHFQARLPAPPTWTTVCYFLALAENFCLRLPAPEVLATGPTIADRLIARVLE